MNEKDEYEKARKQQEANNALFNRLKGQQQALQEQLEEICKEAEEHYGTSDMNALREQYKELKQNLDQKKEAYIIQVQENQTLLKEIEQGLKAIS